MEFSVFAISDFIVFGFWSFLIALFTFVHYQNHKQLSHYKYFLYHVVYKISFAILFGAIYIFYYQGGDTVWYWDGGNTMVNLLMKDPSAYWNVMFSKPTPELLLNSFDGDTGYPPYWIYREPDSFYVCKVTSIFSLITFKSYFTITLLFAFFACHAAWKLYEIVVEQKITSNRNAALAILFIPSVNFWASGIMKDTVVLTCTFYIIVIVYRVFIEKKVRGKLLYFFLSLLLMYWIMKTRAFMLISLIPCLVVWVYYEVLQGIKNKFMRRILIPLIFLAVTGVFAIFYLSASASFGSYSANNIVNTAMVIQKDFKGNTSYSENRYSVGDVDGSPASMILAFPASVIASMYRPFLWEAHNILMLFNGIESMVFMFLTLQFLVKFKFYKWIAEIKKNKFLIFSVIFVLLLGYFVGFTALIFGALVRFKAPLLPFFMLVISIRKTVKKDTSPDNWLT